MSQIKKIQKVEKSVSDCQAKWHSIIRRRKQDFDFELWALESLGSMPDPRAIDDIIIDIKEAKKFIEMWEAHKKKKIELILAEDETALAIYEVFGT